MLPLAEEAVEVRLHFGPVVPWQLRFLEVFEDEHLFRTDSISCEERAIVDKSSHS